MAAHDLLVDLLMTQTFVTTVVGAISLYAATRCIYLLYFHPLAKFPGPRLAAVSNLWYAYHWLSGRYPFAIEKALEKYGDIVRVAPNDLVVFTPKAFTDVYSPQYNGLEVFRKTDFQNRGDNLGGIVWEEDPVRHREVARKLAPAFSRRMMRTMEPIMHKHMDYFVARMKDIGGEADGVSLVDWTHWVAWDTSADLAWNEEMFAMRDAKNPIYLDVLIGFNAFATVIQVFKRFPLISPIKYLFVPIAKLSSLSQMEKNTRISLDKRIDKRGNLPHPDLFDFILPTDSPPPSLRADALHLGSIALQVMFAGFGPMADWYYGVLLFLTQEPKYYKFLVEEVRNTFSSYDDITLTTTAQLPYVGACLEEAIRLFATNTTGLPRYSPGATVDGHYISKGVTIQSSIFTLSRSSRFFHDARRFRPQRWLPPSHQLYDVAFANDARKGLPAFSIGPRACSGRELAWAEARLFLAKVLWQFDIVQVSKPELDMEIFERAQLHYGFMVKPDVKVRFVPREGRLDTSAH
ncbi:cytochrome P450 [Nemania sp. FL0031]|nr:cytochrome P450 [Nemania sp. FL0031]